ncbi:MAG: hypothetical protein K1X74_03505 [Pirellulales bacterium]|nr:hypothetical protein [Pirellulales bacterium]
MGAFDQVRRAAGPLVLALMLSGIGTVSVGAEEAAGFRQLKIEVPAGANATVSAAQRTGAVDNPENFDKFYQARIAEFSKLERLADAGKLREMLKRDLRNYGNKGNTQAHDALNKLLLTSLQRLAGDPAFHPASRVNWTLILGDLNAQEPPLAGTGAPTPLGDAAGALVKLVSDPKQHDAVRAAALVGLLRHAQSHKAAPFLQDAQRQAVVAAMQALAGAETPADRPAEVHQWLQRQSKMILAALGVEVAARATPAAADRAVAAEPPG